jgi:hypothetical protein
MSSSCRVAVSPSSPKASLCPRDDASSSAGVDRCPEDVAGRREKGARRSEKAAFSHEGATSSRRNVSPSSNAAAPSLESDASCRKTAAVSSTPAAAGRVEASLSRATVGLARLEADFRRLVDAFCHQRAASQTSGVPSHAGGGAGSSSEASGSIVVPAGRGRSSENWGPVPANPSLPRMASDRSSGTTMDALTGAASAAVARSRSRRQRDARCSHYRHPSGRPTAPPDRYPGNPGAAAADRRLHEARP